MKIRFELDTSQTAKPGKTAKVSREPYAWLKHLATIISAISAIVGPILLAYFKIKS